MDNMDLQALRQEIDQIDDQLLPLFCRRMALSAQIAACKKELGLSVQDGTREQAILERLCDGLNPEMQSDVLALYTKIFQLSRARQHRALSNPEKPKNP